VNCAILARTKPSTALQTDAGQQGGARWTKLSRNLARRFERF